MKKGKVRVRRRWSVKPTTRVEKDRKKYNRQRAKLDLKKEN
jgi:hypothetical protein